MRSRISICVTMATLGLLATGMNLAGADDTARFPRDAEVRFQRARTTIARGLDFLVKDATTWREERGCATCHHGTMTVWALSEARSQGYPVDAESLAQAVHWTKDQFMPRIQAIRDPRPGWNLVSVPAIHLGTMSQTLPILSRDEVDQIASHLEAHQEADGSWLTPPPSNGAPPIWESRETLALWALLAWETRVPIDPDQAARARVSREKTVAWLNATEPSETSQSIGLRLILDSRSGASADRLRAGVEKLLARQNPDGGWSQTKAHPSDAFATGQALWAISLAKGRDRRVEIGRAVEFLVANQREDGSWPMVSRDHPGVETTRNPIRNPVPITYFGSAWATIGLARSVPSPPDSASRRQRAFDQIRAFHGKYDLDETRAERPVTRVDLRYYEVDDREVAKFTESL
ncbi:MAG: prenyltransferase/squalene oxidase repeat-containing protein, partial [Isosphaeraceae bacterium]